MKTHVRKRRQKVTFNVATSEHCSLRGEMEKRERERVKERTDDFRMVLMFVHF